MYNVNGPPKGANTLSNQSAYDLIFKDVIINSSKRNVNIYPNQNTYSVDLNTNFNKIYKAELIEVYIPAATDATVNIPTTNNTLFFTYNSINYSVVIQAGTYFSPESVAIELSRLIALVTLNVYIVYDKNLNRYNFYDSSGVLSINITNSNNISSILGFTAYNSYSPSNLLPLTSGPVIIATDANNNLYVKTATAGDYGSIPVTSDPEFSNSILSNIVLTDCRIFLSLGKLDGTTVLQVGNTGIPSIFCQIPNNTDISSANVKTMIGQPNFYSSIQFYNPVINDINRLDIKWYSDDGTLLNILDHCFTIRIHYFQKRTAGTDFSTQIINN